MIEPWLKQKLRKWLSDEPVLKGHWRFDVYEGEVTRLPSGVVLTPDLRIAKLVDWFDGWNLITTVGKQSVLDRTFGLGGVGAFGHIGVGNSATTAAIGNTQLLGASTLIQATDSTPTRSNLTVTAVSTFGTGVANFNWQEAALFNGTVNGTSRMLNRIAPIGPFNKTSAVTLVPTLTITQA